MARLPDGRAVRAVGEGVPLSSAGGHARMGGGQVAVVDRDGGGLAVGVAHGELTERLFEAMVGER